MPLGDQSIGWECSMQWARRDSVGVWDVSPGDGTQTHEVEIGVLCNEGIECPFNQGNPASEGVGALEQLELAAYAAVTILAAHRRHVGVEKGLAVAPSCDGHGEANQLILMERA